MRVKKLLLLSSYGGYGHIAAANTLKELLGDEYDIEVVYPIKELRIMGAPSGESFYNFLISKNWNRLTNWIVHNIVAQIFHQRENRLTRLIEKHLEEKKPDMMISLIPFINFPASEAARKSDIPFLMVTTDNDLHNWVFDLKKRRHQNLRVTIGSDLPTTKNTLLNHKIPEESIETIGLPLRPDFSKVRPKTDLRNEYRIPEGKPVVLLMMGGTGANSSYNYAKTILKHPLNVHLMVCTGRNKKLSKKIKNLSTKHGNSIEVIPFTNKIHEVFALADLVITKPGPGTINEALALNVPILIDRMGTPLFWEAANIDFVLTKKIGGVIHSLEEVPSLIKQYLYDKQTREEILRAFAILPKNQFALRIPEIVREMCGEAVEREILMTSRNITSQI